MSTTLEADQLTKIYQEGAFQVPAVQDVTLTARSGEVVAIMGPSGSGKTTLLSMLGCMLRPTSGSITIHGECVSDLDETQLPWVRRRYVGFIFQSFNLFAALSAAENVEIVLQLKGLERRTRRSEARRLLDLVGLDKRADFLPRDMSGGERQRVSIARALAGDPPLILADEPTANLDAKNGEQVMKLLHGRDAVGRPHRDHRHPRLPGHALYRPQRPHRGREAHRVTPMVKRVAMVVALLVVAVAALAFGYTGWRRGGGDTSVIVRVGNIRQTVAAIGRIEPFTEVTLANKIPGRIREVLVKEGDLVKRGRSSSASTMPSRRRASGVRGPDPHRSGGRAAGRPGLESARARWVEAKSGRGRRRSSGRGPRWQERGRSSSSPRWSGAV